MTNEELLYNIHYWEKEKMDALVEHNIKEDARKTGHEQGFSEGLTEGKAEGLAEGRKEGRKEGIESNTIEIIQNMLNKRIDYETISEISGKTVEEIKVIENNMNN